MSFRSLTLSAALASAAWAPSAAWAASIDLRGDTVALAVQTTAAKPEAPVIGSQADLSATLDNLQTDLRFGAEAGDKTPDLGGVPLPWAAPAALGRWNSGKVGLGATWTLSSLAKVELSADNQVRRDIDQAMLNWASPDQQVLSHTMEAKATATLLPASPLNLKIGGEASDQLVQTATVSGPGQAAAVDELRTRTQRMTSTLQWKPLPLLSLEGGGKLETLGVSWEGSGARAGSYAYVEPRIAGALTPWSGAVWSLGVERVVSPLRTDQFVSFAETAVHGAGLTFEPDQEWRYQATLQQKLGDATDLKATYTRARLQSVTDLGPVGTSQAPVDIGAGQRDEVQAALTTSLQILGTTPFTLKASAAWRTSQVEDPFTKALRRLSGETPYDAQLTLSPQAPGASLRWGVNAQASGPATTYQMSQLTTQSASAGLGGFLEYNPGLLTIQVHLDNIVGSGRTQRDVYFTGSRDLNLVDRIEESRNADRVLRLSFSKPL